MIIFTQHALLKLKQRNIRKDLVIKTLKKPDSADSARRERKVVFKKFRKIYLKVVFKKQNKDIIIITQHWVEKVNL